jgi:Dyp-type peroxidase family
MLDLDDIQHFLLTRPHALAARYEFLSFASPEAGRAWLTGILDTVGNARAVTDAADSDTRWVTVAFTWNGLRALGVEESSLATFPAEFREGMAARAEVLGDVGNNHPDHWDVGLAGPDLHAIVILFASDAAARDRSAAKHAAFVSTCKGVRVLSSLDLESLPPIEFSHDHFGYRDKLSQPALEGPDAIKPGEFILGYPDEDGNGPHLPQPEVLSRNGSYLAYRRLQEHVGAFRDFLAQNGRTSDEQEMVAAKLMGRWRSGAPLALAPEKDDPELGADPNRNNAFNYKDTDPKGYAVPLGAHIRRMNLRDTGAHMNRRRMIRRGTTYGRPLPASAADDGVDRGIASFFGCASLVRQFEFTQNVWVNDPKFQELENERDPIIGTQDGTSDMTIPKRPVRKKLKGLPAFTTVKGGAYFFLPGIRALRFLAGGEPRSGES